MQNTELTLLIIERILIFSWLMKDLGWMTTNIYLGYPFGIIAIISHIYLLIIEPRTSFRFYDLSLVSWVIGNFLWMTIELFSGNPSSDIHFGPAVPIGGMSDQCVEQLTIIKTIFFLIGWLTQITLYVGLLVCGDMVAIPEELDEDMEVRDEANMLLCGSNRNTIHSSTSNNSSTEEISSNSSSSNNELTSGGGGDMYAFSMIDMIDGFSEDSNHNNQSSSTLKKSKISLAMIDKGYIIFWISKDFFWSLGTGEVFSYKALAPFWEGIAMCMGCSAILVYLSACYIYRRDLIHVLDNISTIFWISANFVWMCGEFFLRYDNLAYDDGNEGNDRDTRIVSVVLFSLGIVLQLYIIVVNIIQYISLHYYYSNNKRQLSNRNSSNQIIDMSGVGAIKYQTLLVAFSPQHNPISNNNSSSIIIRSNIKHSSLSNNKHSNNINRSNSIDDEDEELAVLF